MSQTTPSNGAKYLYCIIKGPQERSFNGLQSIGGRGVAAGKRANQLASPRPVEAPVMSTKTALGVVVARFSESICVYSA